MELGLNRIVQSIAAVALFGLAITSTSMVSAGNFGGGRSGGVGGVMIDSAGVVRTASVEERQDFANRMRAVLDSPTGELNERTDLRLVSLKGLQAAIHESRQSGAPIPDEASLLAGLQRIEYVFVDEDNHDVLIGGPAEPWELLNDGSIVGKFSRQPTLRLDDLAVALQTVHAARNGGISCSIEPTAEGRQRLNSMLKRVVLSPGQNPQHLIPGMQEAFGPQQVLLSNVPGESRMARTLVAADFEMKRLAMGLVDSPVAGLPSYLDMSRNARHSGSQSPRWWMACDYDDLKRSEDGLAWHITGHGVKTLTGLDQIGKDGNARAAKGRNKIAESWAKKMTEKFDELTESIPVFGDLRNTMDMNVVATLIIQEQLAERAGLDLSVLSSDGDTMNMASYFVPQQIPPHCSFISGVNGWVVTASGGVDINAFEVIQNQKADAKVANTRQTALASAEPNRWWWNR